MYDVTTSAKKNIMKKIGDDRFPSEIVDEMGLDLIHR